MQNVPQYTVLILMIIELGFAVENHRKPKKGNHSFWEMLTLVIMNLFLLYCGGFFDKILN